MNTPTPGQWQAWGCTVYAGDVFVAETHGNTDEMPNGEMMANARLIAAAPDLFAACQAIADLADGQGRANLIDCAAIARLAVAKAEGM